MAHNSTNNYNNGILSVPKDSFIERTQDHIFNDTNNAKETTQIHTLVQTGLIQSTACSDDTSAASEGENNENKEAEDDSSNTLRLVEFIVPVGSLGDHSSIQKVILRSCYYG